MNFFLLSDIKETQNQKWVSFPHQSMVHCQPKLFWTENYNVPFYDSKTVHKARFVPDFGNKYSFIVIFVDDLSNMFGVNK